jgi:hypothetical protein
MEDPHFQSIREGHRLRDEQQQQLLKAGFVVVPDMIPNAAIAELQEAYDTAMASGGGDDYKAASSTTRLNDLVNRGAAFDALYLYAPLLAASSLVIGGSLQAQQYARSYFKTTHRSTRPSCGPTKRFGRVPDGRIHSDG